MTVATLFPPIKKHGLVQSKYMRKLRRTHTYKLRHLKEEKDRLRKLGSGLLPPIMLDSMILNHLLIRMPSLLDNQKTHKQTLEPDFQEDKSESSLHSGSLKGSKVRKISPRQDQGPGPVGAVVRPIQSTTYPSDSEVSRESMYNGNVPVTTLQDGVGSSSRSSIPPLPPIHPGGHMVLTPIGEASREHTQAISLPDYDRYDEEEAERWRQATVTARDSREGMQRPPLSHKEVIQPEPERSEREERRRRREEKRRARLTQQNIDFDSSQGPLVAGGSQLMSSSESLGPGSTASMLSGQNLPRPPQWKGSTQSLRSYGSRKGPSEESHSDVIWESSQAPSLRGSTESPMTIMSKRLESPRSYKTRKTTESNKTQSSQSQPQTQSSGSVVEGESVHGSVVFGPGGELIQVGGTIKPTYKEDRHRDTSDESDVEVPDEWRESRGYRPHSGKYSESLKRFAVKRGSSSKSAASTDKMTEEEVIRALTEHARKVSGSTLSHAGSGYDLEQDIKSIIQEVLNAQKRNSAGPTVAEYRDQIRENLVTAIAKAAGLEEGTIPLDADISPELLQALANQSLTPEDIEIVRDEESGRSIIRSRQHMAELMGGVKEGHIYTAAGAKEAGKGVSIPSERMSNADVGELDIIKYVTEEQGSEKAPSVKGPSAQASDKSPSEKAPSVRSKSPAKLLVAGSIPEAAEQESPGQKTPKSLVKSQVSFKEGATPDEFQTAFDAIEKERDSSPKTDAVSVKSGKSGKSVVSLKEDKSQVSDKSAKKPASPEKRDEFVVGRVDHMEENKKIYGMKPGGKAAGKPKEKKPKVPAPPKKAEAKKGKKKAKGKKKEEEPAETVEEVPPKEPTPQPEKEPTPPPPPSPPKSVPKTPTESERTSSPYTFKSEEEDDQEFIIIRDEETPSPEPVTKLIIATQPSSPESDEKDGKSGEEEEDSEAERLRMISNREARAAKRAAAAEKRKQDVEKKRREREEQQKREKEEAERQERLKQELEENRRRKEEERRLRKEKEAEAEAQEMQEEIEREKRKRAEQEREKRMKEEYQRKLEDMKKKQVEEEARKAEEKRIRDEEERIRREKEEEMLAEMAEQERLEYERRKKEEEEERIRKEEEEKRKREEEAKRAMEEARRLAEEMARKQAELEARLRFNRTLQLEAHGMEHTQDVTRAFVFSYFELLQWLGLDIPEFELLKLNQY